MIENIARVKSLCRCIILAMTIALSAVSCEFEDGYSLYVSKASMSVSVLTYHATTLTGITKGDPRYTWKVKVVEGESFCSAQSSTGKVGDDFLLDLTANESDATRTAKIKIEFSDGYTSLFTITQWAKGDYSEYVQPWAEQPAYNDMAALVHKTYYTTLSDGRYVRNFSICYDIDKMCSRWVAYPAHNLYTSGRDYKVGGSTAGRTNAWAFDDAVTRYKSSSSWSTAYEIVSTYVKEIDTYDTYTNPIIPQSRQANIVGSNSFGSGYARGHMLPSADRYNTWNTNAQTCYSTNIMVQDYDFNSDSWGTLENKVRNNICSDTLYVVVGTLFEKSTTINRNERTISVPSHCFKLLLRTKSGKTGKHISNITSEDELISIGFIFTNDGQGAKTSIADAVVSVSEIERRSGFKFFHILNPAIADKVKSQKSIKDWNF